MLCSVLPTLGLGLPRAPMALLRAQSWEAQQAGLGRWGGLAQGLWLAGRLGGRPPVGPGQGGAVGGGGCCSSVPWCATSHL